MNVEELINRLKKENPQKNVLMSIKDSTGNVITSKMVDVKMQDVIIGGINRPPVQLVVLYDRLIR